MSQTYVYGKKPDGSKTVTLDVVEYKGYEWAVLERSGGGFVRGIKLPFTGSPATEPRAWEKLEFRPDRTAMSSEDEESQKA